MSPNGSFDCTMLYLNSLPILFISSLSATVGKICLFKWHHSKSVLCQFCHWFVPMHYSCVSAELVQKVAHCGFWIISLLAGNNTKLNGINGIKKLKVMGSFCFISLMNRPDSGLNYCCRILSGISYNIKSNKLRHLLRHLVWSLIHSIEQGFYKSVF